jgi:hypothetical protein
MKPETAKGEPDILGVAIIGIVGALVLFAIIVGMQALFYTEKEQVRAGYPPDASLSRRLESEQMGNLGGYAVVDEAKGAVRIPIDVAMRRTVDRLNAERAGGPAALERD